MHPAVLYKLSTEWAGPLTRIFKSNILFGEVPNECRIPKVTPIYKKDSKHDPKNYRPLSLPSQVCRIFERVIKKRMVNYFDINNLMGLFQHGFLKNRSCLTNLVTCTWKILARVLMRVIQWTQFTWISARLLTKFHIKDCWKSWKHWGLVSPYNDELKIDCPVGKK